VPFTGSHAAAVLPFARGALPASALVIGSTTPDLPYYLPVPSEGSHTIVGLIGLDLALGLAVFVLWQAFVGRAVVAFLPLAAGRRLAGYPVGLRRSIGGLRRISLVVVALVLGGLTHLAWDSFTHAHGWIFEQVAWLRADHGPLPGYRWVQWLSEVVAAVIIGAWCVRWWRSRPAADLGSGERLMVRASAAGLVVIAAAVGAVQGAAAGWAHETDPVNEAVFSAVASAGFIRSSQCPPAKRFYCGPEAGRGAVGRS
jgi:hypothetical protein